MLQPRTVTVQLQSQPAGKYDVIAVGFGHLLELGDDAAARLRLGEAEVNGALIGRDFDLVTVATNLPDEKPGVVKALEKQHASTRNLLFGTPDYVAEKIQELQETLNLQYLLVWSSFPGVSHDNVMRSLRLFNEAVLSRI